jgi:hypothetical protein
MQRYALEVDLAKLGDKRDEAMTHIQKSVKLQKFAVRLRVGFGSW